MILYMLGISLCLASGWILHREWTMGNHRRIVALFVTLALIIAASMVLSENLPL